MNIQDLGLQPYEKIWELQANLVSLRANDEIEDQLLLVEHPAVYTTGRAFKPEHLPAAVKTPVIAVERGGSITYHEPGQLVGYPIFKLSDSRRDIHRFLQGIESVLIQTLNTFGYAGERDDRNTGVWLSEKKVAAIGIAVRRWVTWHGFSLNVNNALFLPQWIQPCGFDAALITSLQRESSETAPPMALLKAELIKNIKNWWEPSALNV